MTEDDLIKELRSCHSLGEDRARMIAHHVIKWVDEEALKSTLTIKDIRFKLNHVRKLIWPT